MTRGKDTRELILNTALAESAQLGLEGLSIGALAREVGMSKSGLFAHFGSKQGLQIAVLELGAQLFASRVVHPSIKQPRGEPRVRALFENWLAWVESLERPGGCLFVSTASEFDDRPGPVRDEVSKHLRTWLGTLTRGAELAVQAGHFRADLDPRQFSFELHSAMLGYHLHARLFRDGSARRRACVAVDRLIAAARA